jgi:hypothetical protein
MSTPYVTSGCDTTLLAVDAILPAVARAARYNKSAVVSAPEEGFPGSRAAAAAAGSAATPVASDAGATARVGAPRRRRYWTTAPSSCLEPLPRPYGSRLDGGFRVGSDWIVPRAVVQTLWSVGFAGVVVGVVAVGGVCRQAVLSEHAFPPILAVVIVL